MTKHSCTSEGTSSSCDSTLEKAMETLSNLMLSSDNMRPLVDSKPKDPNLESEQAEAGVSSEQDAKEPQGPATAPSPDTSEGQLTRRQRYRRKYYSAPYEVPAVRIRRKSKSCAYLSYQSVKELTNKIGHIKWKGDPDVEYLKYNLIGERKDVGCGMQAVRPPSPDFEHELDELAEYFNHFVRVESKLSSLAESMYC